MKKRGAGILRTIIRPRLLRFLLAFVGVLDQMLIQIADYFELSLRTVREGCLLHRKQTTSSAYWEHWTQLHQQLASNFYGKAVEAALKQTPSASSLVENFTHPH